MPKDFAKASLAENLLAKKFVLFAIFLEILISFLLKVLERNLLLLSNKEIEKIMIQNNLVES